MNIDEQIEYEREAMKVAIFPKERQEHADKLAKLMTEKNNSNPFKSNSTTTGFDFLSSLIGKY